MPSIKLSYFDIEAAAEPVRLALIVSGIEFEDIRVPFPEWREKVKPTTPYGQLPIMTVDDGPMKTQSGAMLRYVGTLGDLYPREKTFEIEEAIGLMQDLDRAWQPCLMMGMRPQVFGYPEGHSKTEEGAKMVEAMRKKFVAEELPKYLGYFSDMLKRSGGGWIAPGDKPSIADCYVVPNIRKFSRGHLDHVDPDCLNGHPDVIEYIERFCALPGVGERYTSGIGAKKEE